MDPQSVGAAGTDASRASPSTSANVAAAEPAAPAATPAKKPRDAEKRAKDAASAKARRAKKKLLELKDEKKIEQLAVELGVAKDETKAPPADPAAFLGLAYQLWGEIGRALEDTRYAIGCEESELVVCKVQGDTLKMPPEVKTLGDATAPVLAKYVPSLLTTPEAQLGMAVLLVFGPTAAAHAGELIAGWVKKPKPTPALPDDVSETRERPAPTA